jgi:hypothetical protein
MEYPVTWRWEDGRLGEVAHAGNDGHEGTFCGAAAPGPALLHGPWFELRCPTCEEKREGRIEVFYNPFTEEIRRRDRERASRPENLDEM